MSRITKKNFYDILTNYYNFTSFKYNDEGKTYRKEYIEQLMEEYTSRINLEYYLKDKYLYLVDMYIKDPCSYYSYMLGMSIEVEKLFGYDFSLAFEAFMAVS